MTDVKLSPILPLGNRVLCKRVSIEPKKEGALQVLILPDSAKKKEDVFELVSLGTGVKDADYLQIGDRILIDKYAGQDISLNDQEFVIVKFEDVVAILIS